MSVSVFTLFYILFYLFILSIYFWMFVGCRQSRNEVPGGVYGQSVWWPARTTKPQDWRSGSGYPRNWAVSAI